MTENIRSINERIFVLYNNNILNVNEDQLQFLSSIPFSNSQAEYALKLSDDAFIKYLNVFLQHNQPILTVADEIYVALKKFKPDLMPFRPNIRKKLEYLYNGRSL